MRRIPIALAGAALGLAGCWETTRQSHYAPDDPIRLKVSPEVVQANNLAATRVHTLGTAILAANPRIDAKPLFETVGAPQPEIFHNGTSRIVITQGLVEKCPTDPELAAVLSFELGRMVAEREAVSPVNKHRLPLQPMDPGGPADLTNGRADVYRLDELAHAEQQRKSVYDELLPDPDSLARLYLRRTGFRPESIDAVKPQLQMAARNNGLESQLAPSAAPSSVTPPIPR
jgi:hypothetical protein